MVYVRPDFFPPGCDHVTFDCPLQAARFARAAIAAGYAERVSMGSLGEYVWTGERDRAVFVPRGTTPEQEAALKARVNASPVAEKWIAAERKRRYGMPALPAVSVARKRVAQYATARVAA